MFEFHSDTFYVSVILWPIIKNIIIVCDDINCLLWTILKKFQMNTVYSNFSSCKKT